MDRFGRPEGGEIAAGVDQAARHAVALQDPDCPIDCEALGNAAQINLDSVV